MSSQWLELAIDAARQAGEVILEFYHRNLTVEHKGDGSPLTQADCASHVVIFGRLQETGMPVVSEERADLHLMAERYWLVDPLDGTKDFLAGNDEFTVNIALVESQRPALGVVFAPALDELYVGMPKEAAWCVKAGVRSECVAGEKAACLRMAVSRFHSHSDVEVFVEANHIGERVAIGSALKYGRLALGAVDVFPRLVGSSEWDTAAGQAVLEAAGGRVLDWHTGEQLLYGKLKRRNPRLLALRAPYRFADFELKQYGSELL